MPSSVTSPRRSTGSTSGATAAAANTMAMRLPHDTAFHVVPFRRAADGAIVPGAAVEVPNGDIAWRWAMAAAADHENVGAVAFRGPDVMLTSVGQVNLGALRH